MTKTIVSVMIMIGFAWWALVAGADEPASPPATQAADQPATTPAGPSAKYVTTDTTTQGTWKKVYGTDGYVVVGDSQKLPDYAKVTVITEKGELGKEAKNQYIEHPWSASTTDVRALQKVKGTDRIAALWGSYGGITIDVDLTDDQAHRIALYCLDFGKSRLKQKIEVLDPDTEAVLDTRTVEAFDGGLYLVWDIKGHVKLRLTTLTEARAVLSGLFFGQDSAAPAQTQQAADAGAPPVAPAVRVPAQPAAQPATHPAKELTLELGSNVTMKLVLIPAGRFMRGSPNNEKDRNAGAESPQHEVTITKPFYMGVYEVTQAQYQQVMGKNPSTYKDPTFPAGNMRWKEAVEFGVKASEKTGKTVRLPTEAEWEYACRAGTTTRFSFGDDEEQLDDYAWTPTNSDGKPHPVGQKKPNAFGLYDMHGNVYEWVHDFRDYYPKEKKVVDPKGPDESKGGHVIRGGSFYRGCRPHQFRCAYRGGEEGKEMRTDCVGFRVVVNAE